MADTLLERYKRAFFTGLAALLPTLLTIFVLFFCWNVINDYVAGDINKGIRTLLATPVAQDHYWKSFRGLEDWQLREPTIPPRGTETSWTDDQLMPFSERVDGHVPVWLGLLLAFVLVLLLGFVFKGYVGRQLLRMLERWILRLPIIKLIYPYAKQITEFFFEGRRPVQYESAVAIQYPRIGIYSVGFVTNEGFRDISKASGKEMVSIFIPSSPTPITGYTIVVHKDEVIPLNMSVEQALRFSVSAGVLLPPGQLPPLALKTRKLDRPE